ncbi:MAG: hydantoinase B/oxoprolinase family protein [Deltaproteobacteria bacterium]|nr:hydantoinase B/oxoprolinase family protein [Deltaproteobacteria bacterium]
MKRQAGRPGDVPDSITVEVIRGFLETVCDEMSLTMKRTAVTPIFSESSDYSCAVMDGRSRLIAQALRTASLPVHMGAMKFSVEGVLRDFAGDIHDGDIFLVNDPYHGGSHIPDLTMVMPVHFGGELVLFPAVRAHQMDTGAMTPGSYSPTATEIWQEGLRLPPIRICDGGRLREDLVRMLELNTRLPTFRGDLMAMLAACRIGARRIHELLSKYGVVTVRAACDEAIARGVRRIRATVAAWPDGDYVGEAFLDHDGMGTIDINVRCTLRIRGDRLCVDLTGSHTQVASYVNSSKANSYSNIYLGVATMMDPEIPKNEAFFEAVDIVLPAHSVVNADPPAPVTACTLNIGGEIAEAVAYAFEAIEPERVYPQTLKIGALVMSVGMHPDSGELFLDANIDSTAGWSSAVHGMDGWGGLPNHYGMATLANAEIVEMRFPYRVVERELAPDTGGAGQWRGCCGSRGVKRVLAPMLLNFSAVGRRWPVRGIAGGRDGSPNCWTMDWGTPQAREATGLGYMVPLAPDTNWCFQLGGGGGWGDPLDRDPAAVLEDVLDGYVSARGAKADYGVVLSEDGRAVDTGATSAEREALRRARLAMAAPARS